MAEKLCDLLVFGDRFTELRLMYHRYYGRVHPLELQHIRSLQFASDDLRRMQDIDKLRGGSGSPKDMDWPKCTTRTVKKRDFEATIESDETRGTIVVMRRPATLPEME